MIKRYAVFFLLCITATFFGIFGFGCKGDDPKDISQEKGPPAMEAEKTTGTKVPVVKETKKIEEVESLPAQEIHKPALKDTVPKEDIKDVPKIEIPRDILLLSPLWQKHTKKGVKFTHERHVEQYQIACNGCHHIYENGTNVWKDGMKVDRCETCHDETTVKGETRLSPDAKAKNLKLAFHKNCQGCHRKLRRADSSSQAPTTCGKCHNED